ncbi:TrbC/VirB2 family protein [Massilia sp. DD77]|uniref:TrbC/VirB2 family protein n=1 Tax=Massilia sp. DD77 TaxID=3109349 RepID=UPI002FFEE299
MRINVNRAVSLMLMATLCALQTSPVFAQFTGAGTQATNWFVQLLTPIIPLAVAVVGTLAWTGRVNWGWFVGAIVGTALFFGRDQVVTMLRAWTGT